MPPVCSLHLQQNPMCGSSVLVPGTPSRGSLQPGIAKPRAIPLEMPLCPLTPHQATTQLCHRALLNPSCLEQLPQVVLTTVVFGTVSRDWDTPILGVTAALAACEVTNPTKLSPCNAPASPEPGNKPSPATRDTVEALSTQREI